MTPAEAIGFLLIGLAVMLALDAIPSYRPRRKVSRDFWTVPSDEPPTLNTRGDDP